MKHTFSVIVITLLGASLAIGGRSSLAQESEQQPEAHSLLNGRALYPPERSPEVEERLEGQLAEAREAYEADPTSEEAVIWYGRRLAYLSRYCAAIDVYTQGLESHPQSPRLLRHRGHRYISIREFDRAVNDLSRAEAIVREQDIPDEIEPDGMPNSAGMPRSTMHWNIYYHWALAEYLQGHFDAALEIWLTGLDPVTMNDDMRVAFLYWIHNALVRLGDLERAQEAIASVHNRMEVIENFAYQRLLLLFKGERAEASFSQSIGPGDAFDATLAYGVAIHRLARNDDAGWVEMLEQTVAHTDQWASFGYIAAEADLARIQR